MDKEKLEVKNARGLLFFKEVEPWLLGSDLTPLIPENKELNCLNYYIFNMGGIKTDFEFEIRDSGIWVHVERHKFKKIREL